MMSDGQALEILSLFDFSGVWSAPYAEAGYRVTQIDLQHGTDIYNYQPHPVHGILAAPPCTEFAVSGARWFAEKDADGRTAAAVMLIRQTLWIINQSTPVWWALENPVGRLARLVPELGDWRYSFHPCDFGEPYTKRTLLWGDFNTDLATTPVVAKGNRVGQPNAWYSAVGGKSQATKNYRSQTSPGFAAAFFKANP
jgi:hypothetical protein